MSEPRGDYKPDALYRCQGCGAVIGELVEVDGRVLLRRTGLYIEWAPKMWCSCGQFLHFAASDEKLSDILARRKNDRATRTLLP